MQRHHLRTLALAALTLAGASAHAVPVLNPSFNAALSSWTGLGDVSAQTGIVKGFDLGSATALVLGTASTGFEEDAPAAAGAFNVSGSSPVEVDALEATLGVPVGALSTPALDVQVQEGSALTQTFVVQAGQTLSFDWRLLTRANDGPLSQPDTAWLTWSQGGSTTVVKLGDTESLALSSGANGWLASSLIHSSYTASALGSVTLGFAVADVNSYDLTSVLAVQNLTLSAAPTPAVPEPDSIALILVGLGLMAGVARRQIKA
jgi:hypothetical protein